MRKAAASESLDAGDRPVFEALREWRAGVAKELGVPAYIVFGDATLRALAEHRPATLADLDGVTGIGAKKREAYGEAVLEVIRRSSRRIVAARRRDDRRRRRRSAASAMRPRATEFDDEPSSNIDIAQAANMLPIQQIAERLGIPEERLEPYGRYKAKISLDYLAELDDRPDGKLVLVTAVSPTPAGEGKTTTTVGLGDALSRIGKRAMICLREPALGPVFGMKGGAAGGGYAQVVPMEDINLHFTGDFSAIAVANNLLAALIDNHIHHGNELGIDVRRITWRRVLDVNDRALRDVVDRPRRARQRLSAPGRLRHRRRVRGHGDLLPRDRPRRTSSERLGEIVIGYTRDRQPVRARDLEAHGAMTAILRDALAPNLVQTLENTPAFVHGGPFANIAHGCNSSWRRVRR